MKNYPPRNYKILAVDDKRDNLTVLSRLLREVPGVEVIPATSGNGALALTLEHEFCVAIVDVQMPDMDGYELVELLRGNPMTAQLPVIFVSAIFSDEYHHRKAYDVGAVDFMSKPFIPEILLSKIRVFISLYEQRIELQDWSQKLELLVAQRTEELAQSYDATLEGWAMALEMREHETAGHSRRVVALTRLMAEALGIPAEDQIHLVRGALLHDIGKMGIPDAILLKPGNLGPEEWKIMRQHPVSAYELLRNIRYLQPAISIPYYHHERWDGSGYPFGLSGTDIPLGARIFAIVDVWDAMRSERPYRPSIPAAEVIAYFTQQSGLLFEPRLVKIFLEVVKEQ